MTAATVNVAPHIIIENGVILCGAQNHYDKRPKAKTVSIDLVKPSRRQQPEEGTYVEARDGVKVTIGSAYCGVHKPEWRTVTMSPEMVLDLMSTPDLILDYAKRLYEKKLDEESARQAEANQRWAKHRQADHADTTFTARRSDEHGAVAAWLIEGRNPDTRDGEAFPMTWVQVNEDGGVLWVTTSDYMNSGPGRGNPSWTKVFIETMQAAAEVQAAGVKEEGK